MAEKIKGKGVIAGIAVGKIMLAGQNLDGYLKDYKPKSKDKEKKTAADALIKVAEDLKVSIEKLKKQDMQEQAAILEAHRMMVEDPAMSEAIDAQVEESGSAPKAVLDAYEAQAQLFEGMDDEYFRGRAVDMRDVGKRIAKYILGIKEPEIGEGKVIVAGHEIEPSVIAGLPSDKIAGVILGQGSVTSHAIIIAKTRALPAVVGVGDAIDRIGDGDPVILDGDTGEILIRPSDAERESYNDKIQKQEELKAHYAKLRTLPATTTDGTTVTLAANIGSPDDVDAANNFGAEGVGLFRSEFVFMGKQDIPKEEDQFKEYKAAVEKCNGNLCIIRTMDIGGAISQHSAGRKSIPRLSRNSNLAPAPRSFHSTAQSDSARRCLWKSWNHVPNGYQCSRVPRREKDGRRG